MADGSASFVLPLVAFGYFWSTDVQPLLTDIHGFINGGTYWEIAASNKQIGYLRRTLEQYKTNWEEQFKNKKK